MTPKASQGMRQPQIGGVLSRTELTVARPLCAGKHARWWRIGDGHPWVCGTCHPPAFGGVEWREQ